MIPPINSIWLKKSIASIQNSYIDTIFETEPNSLSAHFSRIPFWFFDVQKSYYSHCMILVTHIHKHSQSMLLSPMEATQLSNNLIFKQFALWISSNKYRYNQLKQTSSLDFSTGNKNGESANISSSFTQMRYRVDQMFVSMYVELHELYVYIYTIC